MYTITLLYCWVIYCCYWRYQYARISDWNDQQHYIMLPVSQELSSAFLSASSHSLNIIDRSLHLDNRPGYLALSSDPLWYFCIFSRSHRSLVNHVTLISLSGTFIPDFLKNSGTSFSSGFLPYVHISTPRKVWTKNSSRFFNRFLYYSYFYFYS